MAPALGWMGSMVPPAKEALGTTEGLWGHGMCFHAEERTPQGTVRGAGFGASSRGWVLEVGLAQPGLPPALLEKKKGK